MDQRNIIFGLASGFATGLLILAAGAGQSGILQLFISAFFGLPIALTVLAFGPIAGLLATISGFSVLALTQGGSAGIGLLLTIAIPIGITAYFTAMAQPSTSNKDGPLIWFPLDRLIIILGALIILCTTILSSIAGLSLSNLEQSIRIIAQSMAQQPEYVEISERFLQQFEHDPERFIGLLASVQGALLFLYFLFNLWLSIFISRKSGLLQRSRGHFLTLRLPMASVGLLALIYISMDYFGGMAGYHVKFAFGILAAAFAVSGLGFLHFCFHRSKYKGALLGIVYGLIILLFFPAFALILLGVGDSLFDFRRRFSSQSPGAPPRKNPDFH